MDHQRGDRAHRIWGARRSSTILIAPHSDYSPILEAAGFAVDAYEETPGWASRVYGTFEALVDAADALVADLGERAAAGVLAEAMLTVQTRPYPRRILLVTQRLD
jgi:hypothetical protein